MDDQKNSIAAYFGAPEEHYWRWSDNGDVIEYGSDLTICYTDELITILEEINDQGWPPLGSILLLLIACKAPGKHILTLKYNLDYLLLNIRNKDGSLFLEIQEHLQQTIKLMNIVGKLPVEYRSGKKRSLLLKTIFAGIPPVVPTHKTTTLLHFFYKDTFVNNQDEYTQLIAELAPLSTAAQQITDTDTLELQLRTSLKQLPEALPV